MIATRRLVQLALPIVVSLAMAGAASGYLSSSGGGAGSGRVAVSLSNLTVSGGAVTQPLLPIGIATGDVAVTLTNGNPSPLVVRSLALDTSQGTGGFSPNAAGCALSFATQSNGGAGWTVPANSSLSVDLLGSLTMGTAAANGCQGQSFTVYLTAS